MLLMAHANAARLDGGGLFVDRKFHTGMQEYIKRLSVPLLSLHPYLPPDRDHTVMDLVRVPTGELGYEVKTFEGGPFTWQDNPVIRHELAVLVEHSQLVYGADRFLASLAKRASVPSVTLLEYNLRTMMVFAASQQGSAWKRIRSRASAARYYAREIVPAMRSAAVLHCNGYPVFQEARWFNSKRLLYLDSRMSADAVIPLEQLTGRLARRRDRPPKLIFSGRFEPAKGALDVVLAARACAAQGFRFTIDLYGQGSQRDAMDRVVAESGLSGAVNVHDALPYPELLQRTRDSDLFVCCHTQDDPSCTYLETFGCGVPIAGYGNAMWTAMQADSAAGTIVPLGDIQGLAASIVGLCSDQEQLDKLSMRARSFALSHTFEEEFSRRTDSLREIMAQGKSA